MAEAWDKNLVAQLEALGETEVRISFNRGDYGLTGGSKSEVVKNWLDSKEAVRKSARDVESLSISRKALCRATWANIIAAIAMALSAIVAIFK